MTDDYTTSHPPRWTIIAKDLPVFIDLGCGFGGLSQAFLDCGFRVIGIDNARQVVEHYPAELILQNIESVDGHRLARLNPRVVGGAPPCTWLSSARNRWGRDTELGMILVREFMRVIREADPPYWFIENVRGAVRYISREFGPPLYVGRHNQGNWFWGNIPVAIVPRVAKTATSRGRGSKSTRSWTHSIVPYPVAHAIAEACLP